MAKKPIQSKRKKPAPKKRIQKQAKVAKKQAEKQPKNEKKKQVPKKVKKVKVVKKEKAAKKAAPQEKKQPKRQASGKKKATVTCAYNASQLETYKEWKQKLQKNSNAELKEMLKKNDQTSTGTKDELIEKIADGKAMGKIPRCPSCFGGRLRFDDKTGVYNCPGYRDDTDFHNCQKKYQLGEITRDTWID